MLREVPARKLCLLAAAWPCLLALLTLQTCPAAAAWSYRWRSLNETNSSGGGQCTAVMQTADLAAHFSEALVDIVLYQALGEANNPDVQDNCYLTRGALDHVSKNLNTNSICLNPHGTAEMLAIQQYLQLLQRTGKQPAVIAATLAAGDYQDPAGALLRGFFVSLLSPTLTSGVSETELVSAAYQYIAGSGWSYVGLVWEAELGADRLSRLLQSSATSDRRVCFPLSLSFQSGNATVAAKALKEFVYTTKTLSRFTVVFVGSGATFLSLWDLVSGSDGAYADSEKRYQFVVIGDALGSYHKVSDTTRRRNLALGTVFVFPGILDPDPSSDELRILFSNITSDPGSMGRFSALRDTHARLRSLKDATSSLCSWSDAKSACYQLALRYDFLALGLASLLADGTPSISSLADVQQLRQKVVTLSTLQSKLTILGSFVRQGYILYSMDKGLLHSSRGYWQPIVKIYQNQLNGSSSALVKLGELRIKQAGTASQSYEFDMSAGGSQFYKLTSGNADILPTSTGNSASDCPASCPECLGETTKQFIQYKEGDIYLGALAPVFFKGSDIFNCTDSSFRQKTVGGYEFAMAFKFIVELVDALSQGSSALPPGYDASLVDQQFLMGVKELLQRVHDRRTKRLRWGYVVLDTCYSPSCTVRRLGSLLDGTMGVVPGFNFSKVVGFIGALSSTQTMASSQLLKMYNLPLITYGSTSTALSDVDQYPYVLRTVASDTVIIEAMVSVLKYLKVNYISVLYAPTAYGMSLRDEMTRIAAREGICIAQLTSYDCGGTDNNCKWNTLFSLKKTRARYVTFLGTLQDLISLLSYSQAEADIDYLTLLTTESVGVSDAAFVGKNNAGLGTLSLKLVSSQSPAFSAYVNYTLTRVPPNANNISEWDRLYFEDAQQCYLPGSFSRNPAFSQACLQTLVGMHPATDLESRSPFVIDAASTLVLGTLTAMTYLCQVVTPEPACSKFYWSDFLSMQQRTSLIMYGTLNPADLRPQSFSGSFNGAVWAYQKVFDNRMGQTPFSVWQYRKQGSADYKFVQIGQFDGANASTFTESAQSLTATERSPISGGAASTSPCKSRAECGGDTAQCVNSAPLPVWPPASPSGGGVQGSQLSFLGFLFIPGFLLGFLPVFFVNLYIRLRGDEGPYEMAQPTAVDSEAQAPSSSRQGGSRQNGQPSSARVSSGDYVTMRVSAASLQQQQQQQQQQSRGLHRNEYENSLQPSTLDDTGV